MHIMSLCIRVSQTDIGTNPDRQKLDNQMQKDTQKERHADRHTDRQKGTRTQKLNLPRGTRWHIIMKSAPAGYMR